MNISMSKFPVGVIGAFTKTEAISAAMRAAMDGVSGEAYIVDPSGLLVMHPLNVPVNASVCLTCLTVSVSHHSALT